MSLRVSEEEVREHLSEYLDRAERGEEIVVTRNGRPVVELRRVLPGLTGAEFLEMWRNAPHLSPEEAEAFARDVEEARRELNAMPVPDPWQES
jgi:antitoxin (DNA-binding transcriptional repressor) of toxin-antitoxin stability system